MIFNDINPNKLLDDFNLAGIKTKNGILSNLVLPGYIAENSECEFVEGTDIELVQRIIDAHNPTPLPSQPTETEILKSEIDFQKMAMESQQADIDFLKLMGGI